MNSFKATKSMQRSNSKENRLIVSKIVLLIINEHHGKLLSKTDAQRSLVVKNSTHLFWYLIITSPLKVSSVYFPSPPLITDVNPDLINGKRATPPIKKRCHFMCQCLSDVFIFSSVLRRLFLLDNKSTELRKIF